VKRAGIIVLIVITFALGGLLTCVLEACELHNPPPCTPGGVYPDPCVAASRDAGRDR